MKSTLNVILIFVTILTLFIAPFLPSAVVESYKSFKYIDGYKKEKVKIDSVSYRNNSGAKGSRNKYYLIYHKGGVLKLKYPFNKLTSLKIDKLKYEHFKKSKQDSMYLWINPKAKPIFGMKQEIVLDSRDFGKKLLINLTLSILSLVLYLRVFFMLKKSRTTNDAQ